MKSIRLLVPLAVVVGSVAAGGVANATTPTVPGAGCIDPTTAPTTAAPATTVAAAPTTQPAGAVPFTSPEGDFTVTFPGEPQVQDVPGARPGTSTWRFATTSAEFIVSRLTLGAGEFVDLRASCEGALQTGGGTLVSSAPITVQGHLGIEVVATVGTAGVVQRIIDGGTALYQLIATSRDALTPADPAVAAFFGSFQLAASADAPATTAPVVATTAPVVATTAPVVATTAPAAVTTAPVAVTTVPVGPTTAPVAPTTAPAPASWTLYTSPTDGYTVGLPGEPEVSSEPMTAGDGSSVPLSTARVNNGERAWIVNYFAVPAGGTFDLEVGRDGSLGDFSATLVSSTPIELAGRTGLEFVGSFIQNGEPATVISRLYTDGAQVHQLLALAFGTVDATDPEIAGFFGSFSFTGATS